MFLVRAIQILFGAALCAVALVLPYRLRLWYMQGISAAVHGPYELFGRLVRYLMAKLRIEMRDVYGKS